MLHAERGIATPYTRKLARTGEVVRLSATDPLNLIGVILPGARVPAIRTREVVYCDGLPLEAAPLAQPSAG